MKLFRAAVAVVAIVVWVLSAPLAMASNNCMAMGAMCEGPCGASSCAVSVVPAMTTATLVTAAYAPETARIPDPPVHLLELPPK